MRFLIYRIWLLAAVAGSIGVAAESPGFSLWLEGVKFDYPGAEYWAEIEGPNSSRSWAFAIYCGQGGWQVPLPAATKGIYRVLRVERRAGDTKSNVGLGTNSQALLELTNAAPPATPMVPQPPLVAAGEFTTFYAAAEPWCVNDHTFVQGPDHTWHLFGITHPKPLSWENDPGRQLAHATAANLLENPWQTQPFAVKRDWDKHRELLLWAPHVIRHEGTYYMFVCVGAPDNNHSRYRIHLLTSPDLKEWTRHPNNPMVVDGFDGRDPFVTRLGDQWVMYYTANSTPECGNHTVACVTSTDLVHWSNRRTVFTHPRAGSFGGPTESPFVVRRGNSYYLFACDNDWTDVYVSTDPFQWEFAAKNTRIRSHASEIVRDTDGKWFISHAGWMSGPLKLAPLQWNDGLDGAPTNILPAEK